MRRGFFTLALFAGFLLVSACTGTRSIEGATDGVGRIDITTINQWQCGQQTIQTDFSDERVQLLISGTEYWLEPAIPDSGAKYQSSNGEVVLWFKATEASLTMQGRQYPVCLPPHGISEPWRAGGNEPFWTVIMDEGLLTLHRLGYDSIRDLPYQVHGKGLITAGESEQAITLRLTDGSCRDTMSDMIYPQRAELVFSGETLRGCSGDPARLLQGVEWVVEELGGRSAVDHARAVLNFDVQGRISGTTGCNRFSGSYGLSGERMSVSQLGVTKMACEPVLMEQEARLLQALQSLHSFDFDETGKLLLRGSGGSLRARADS